MDSVEYLQNVLENWEEFCNSHKKFKRAIENLLLENFMLKEELRKLKDE